MSIPKEREMKWSPLSRGVVAALASVVLSGGAALAASGPVRASVVPYVAVADCHMPIRHVNGRCTSTVGPMTDPDTVSTAAPAGSSSAVAAPMPLGPPGRWSLKFEDNFNVLNRSVWTPYWFRDCSGSVMNRALTCSGNVSVANGELRLQMSAAGNGALVTTNPKDGVAGHAGAAFGLAFYEARIHFPGSCRTRISNWPAWWTGGQSWPGTGENDIAESLSGVMHSNYHSQAGNFNRPIPGCWAGKYHTYGLHRLAGRNDVYFDGRLVHSYATADGAAPHFLILNVGYSPGSLVLGPAGAVKIDYVRVWQ
jgi:hypothetical protein